MGEGSLPLAPSQLPKKKATTRLLGTTYLGNLKYLINLLMTSLPDQLIFDMGR